MPVFQPNPVPALDKPVFHPELPHKKTDVQPFQFESRYEGKPTRRDIIDGELKRQEEELIKVGISKKYSLWNPNNLFYCCSLQARARST